MKLEILHSRQRQLLALLKEQQHTITSSELATKMKVSDRTFRNDIRALNTVLKQYNAKIETIRGKGIILRTEGTSAALLNDPMNSDNTLQTREDRANFLIVKLLLSDADLELGELEDEMFVSRTTLENDIRFVRKYLAAHRPYLHLERSENRIFIKDEEWKKRLLLTKIFAESWDYHTREGVLLKNSPLKPDTIDLIFKSVKKALKLHNVKLDDYDLIAFVFTIAVAEYRIRTGHPLDTPSVVTADSLKTAELVKSLMDDIESQIHIHFGNNERNNIMLSLSFRHIPDLEQVSRQSITNIVDHDAISTVDLFLSRLYSKYGIDFSWDEKLYVDLAYYVFMLEKRLRYSYERKNSILPTIKTRFIFYFELAMVMRDCFQKIYGMDISEDEWGYFADYLVMSANRAVKVRFPNGIPVALISHLSRSDREMVASQIQGFYGNAIKVIGPFSIYEKEKIIRAEPELILSTVQLEKVRPELVNIPHMTIATTFKEDMLIKLNRYIQEIKDKSLFPPLPEQLQHYFSPELFFTDLEFATKEEVITFMTQQIVKLGYAGFECISQAIERERLSSTVTEYGIAIPRVHSSKSSRTIICVAQLKNSIHWDGQKVSMVFLTSATDEDLPIYGTLLNYLANILCRREQRKRLAHIQTFNDFLALL